MLIESSRSLANSRRKMQRRSSPYRLGTKVMMRFYRKVSNFSWTLVQLQIAINQLMQKYLSGSLQFRHQNVYVIIQNLRPFLHVYDTELIFLLGSNFAGLGNGALKPYLMQRRLHNELKAILMEPYTYNDMDFTCRFISTIISNRHFSLVSA